MERTIKNVKITGISGNGSINLCVKINLVELFIRPIDILQQDFDHPFLKVLKQMGDKPCKFVWNIDGMIRRKMIGKTS